MREPVEDHRDANGHDEQTADQRHDATMAHQRRHHARGPVEDRGDEDEGQPQPERVGDQEDRALGHRAGRRGQGEDAAQDDPDARAPADREDRAKPERGQPATARGDEVAADPIPDGRARTAAPERGRAGGGRQRSGGAGVERTPGSLEGRDVEQTGEVETEHDEDDAADRPERRQIVDERPGHERAHDAEEREHRPEPGDVREGVPDREPP